jgi:hypothetical protein
MASITLGTIPGSGFWPLNKDKKVIISEKDLLNHTHVLGLIGQGKSYLIASMILQLYKQGIGVTLLDPHGTTIDIIRDQLISWGVFKNDPKAYEKIKIIRFQEGDYYPAYDPMAFDFLSESGKIDFFLESSHRVWKVLQEAALFDQVFHHGLITLRDNKLPLSELFYVYGYTPKERYNDIYPNIKDPATRFFWERIWDNMGADKQATYGGSASRRADVFTKKPLLKYTTGQLGKNVLNPREAMDKGKLVLISLAGADEESQRILGAMITHSYEVAAASRAPRTDLPPHYYVLEEMGQFVNNSGQSLAKMLDTTRKWGLFTVLCHQRFEQSEISSQLPSALTNAGIRVSFRIGVDDARLMAPVYQDYSHSAVKKEAASPTGQPILANAYDQYENAASYLRNMEPQHAMVKLPKGPPVEIKTLHLPDPGVSRAEIAQVEQEMIDRYSTPIELVDLPHDRPWNDGKSPLRNDE